ncbi:MAG TPA: tRNA lysidine(34) synthetase TilS [Fibrobacteres bacterium]|nr:tRNA lysidine(34) synthetase TilS [Fibrobacterota bacterium]
MPQAPIFNQIILFFREYLPHKPLSVCVAVSGGADSVALFRLLFLLKTELGINRLGIAHVNHKLRGKESDGDAEFVESIAKSAGVPFFLKNLTGIADKDGIESWARKERYDFFSSIQKNEEFQYVATGHTADDQAETVLMRIMRGTGLKGLCAISPVRADGIVRPLLYIKRADLRSWFLQTGGTFREDSSNTDTGFLRNRVRHEIIPVIEEKTHGTVECLAKIAQSASITWAAFQPIINKWIEDNVLMQPADVFCVKKSGFADEALAQECAAELLRKNNIDFNYEHVEALIVNSRRKNGKFLLPGGWGYFCKDDSVEFVNVKQNPDYGCEIRAEEEFCIPIPIPGIVEYKTGKLLFTSEIFRKEPSCPITFSKENMLVFLDKRAVGNSLEFRSVRCGDIFRPLGSKVEVTLKNYLKKQKAAKRVTGVVAKKNGEIIWIPGLQISDCVGIKSQTDTILKIYCNIIE